MEIARQEIVRQGRGRSLNDWFNEVAPFRKEALARVVEAENAKRKLSCCALEWSLLRLKARWPMYSETVTAEFVVRPNPKDGELWVASRPAQRTLPTLSRWLRSKKIDLIVVVVPRPIEVYPDLVSPAAPADRLVTPHLRHLLLRLLEQDVEVLDLLPAFLKAREPGALPLYYATDPHIPIPVQEMVARAICQRLARHPEVAAARLTKAPEVRQEELEGEGMFWKYLSAAEQAEALPFRPELRLALKTPLPPRVSSSPVLVVGDSFGTYVLPALAQQLGFVPPSILIWGSTTQPWQDLVREPEILAGKRAVIWITNSWVLGQGTWAPLPKYLQG